MKRAKMQPVHDGMYLKEVISPSLERQQSPTENERCQGTPAAFPPEPSKSA